ncbi:MAG: uroporphyrinogen-III synthase [Micavibrio sp.]|nr:MAG: uroporphyrinogen-III synthase [Micavibrio sp.]
MTAENPQKPLVLVTRPQPQNSETCADLQQRGFSVFAEPLLQIRATPHEVLEESDAEALVFTSRNAAEKLRIDTEAVLHLPVYAVGKRTADALKNRGFSDIRKTADTAAMLQNHLDTLKNLEKIRFLHISGRDRAHVFSVGGKILPVREVYKAVRTGNFTENLRLALHNGRIGAILFYSVRTAENFMRLAKDCDLLGKCASITIICISTRTADVAGHVRWKKTAVAEKPDHRHMMKALEEAF